MDFKQTPEPERQICWDENARFPAFSYRTPMSSQAQWRPRGDHQTGEYRSRDLESDLDLGLQALNPFLSPSPDPIQHSSYTRIADRNAQDAAPVGRVPHGLLANMMTGVSLNYLGDPFLPANQSANIPDSLNTSLWITNLPPDLDYKMLLDSVRHCGKVYATVINGPDRNHTTAACKLVFFDIAGAESLLFQARSGLFHVGGYMPSVCRNRIKTEAKPPSPSSRVLHIEGPRCIVNQPYLAALFRNDGITWQDEVVITLYSTESLTRLEWRFGSYRCQAESARHLIDRVKKRELAAGTNPLWQGVTVHFGVDPCAPKAGEPTLMNTHRLFTFPDRLSGFKMPW